MTTLEELINIYNIHQSNAELVIKSDIKHLGYQNGLNKVTDIEYLGNGDRDVEITCTECGRITHQVIPGSKWYKIHKTCPCQKERRKAEIENLRKIKGHQRLRKRENILESNMAITR